MLYKILNDYETRMIESIFLALDSGKLSESYCEELVDYLRRKNKEAYKYVLRLLNRWVLLRLNKYHLPKRINRIICLNDVVNDRFGQ